MSDERTPFDATGRQFRIDQLPSEPTARRQAIERELHWIRKAASAARWEARQAELERMLMELDQPDVHSIASGGEDRSVGAIPPTTRSGRSSDATQTRPDPGGSKSPAFASWNAVRDAQREAAGQNAGHRIDRAAARADSKRIRRDHAHSISRPHFAADEPSFPAADGPTAGTFQRPKVAKPKLDGASRKPASPVPTIVAGDDDQKRESDSTTVRSRRRSLTLALSAILHALILLMLGWLTLSRTLPEDSLSLKGATSSPAEETIESLSIKTTELEVRPEEPASSPVQYDFSPVGDVAATAFSPQSSPGSQPATARRAAADLAESVPLTLEPTDTAPAVEFCGISGGGSHFVYLVDSSGSMGDAFAPARLALLRSIASLRPDQRFYVVFFDEEPDYMRLSDPDRDEPHSVPATAENKERLRRWAMRVQMNRGKAPYEPLEFALEQLKPDAIFLLSDGEFPQRIVDLLDERNRRENLFGDVKPISRVHTIAYHSEDGEARMRLIAKRNGGRYRYVQP